MSGLTEGIHHHGQRKSFRVSTYRCRYFRRRWALGACRTGGRLRESVRSDPMQEKGFSLMELVIVAAILAVLAAIALPRLSRGSRGASDAALDTDLAALQKAIDLFATEHDGQFPRVVIALPSNSRSTRTARETFRPRRTPSTSTVRTCVPSRLCQLATGGATPG